MSHCLIKKLNLNLPLNILLKQSRAGKGMKLGQRVSHAFCHFCVQLSGAEKPPAGEPENSSSSSATAAGAEAADGGSKVISPLYSTSDRKIRHYEALRYFGQALKQRGIFSELHLLVKPSSD